MKGLHHTGRISVRKAKQAIRNYLLVEASKGVTGIRKVKTITPRDTASGRHEIHFYVPRGVVWATNERSAKPRKS